MDEAICEYMRVCGVSDVGDVDFSYINQEIEDSIVMMGGEVVGE